MAFVEGGYAHGRFWVPTPPYVRGTLKKVARLSFAVAIAAACGLSSVAHAQTVPDLGDLIGVRGSSAEAELQSRGYQFITNLGWAALWWNHRTKPCATVAVDDARVQSIGKDPATDCGKKADAGESLSHLIGVRGSSAEAELKSRGYQLAGNRGSAALWWNASTKSCVSVAVINGRLVSILTSPKWDCRQQ